MIIAKKFRRSLNDILNTWLMKLPPHKRQEAVEKLKNQSGPAGISTGIMRDQPDAPDTFPAGRR